MPALLARDCQFLSVSSAAAQRELGDRIEMYYRNANIRIAVSAELLNRMIPKREPEFAPVKDNIQGADVRGESLMASEVTVRMLPDPHHVRLALEVNGEVASLTRSTSGPATFLAIANRRYIARKPIEISLRGIQRGAHGSGRGQQVATAGHPHRFRRVPHCWPFCAEHGPSAARRENAGRRGGGPRKNRRARRRTGSIARRRIRLRQPPNAYTTRCSARWTRWCWIR